MTASGKPELPLDALAEGVRLSLANARDLLEAARGSVAVDQDRAAAVLLYQAAEEVGKAKLLEDARTSGRPPSVKQLANHAAKFELARTVIPAECLDLRPGAFQRGAFQADAFDVGDVVEWSTRGEGLYVDWDPGSGRWRPPLRPDPATVAGSIECLADLVDKWLAKLGA